MKYTEFKNLITENCSIYLDTNCFLSLYNLPSSLVKDYFSAFNQLECDIRISPRVKMEFDRHKSSIKKESKAKLDDSINIIKQDLEKVTQNFIQLKRNMKRSNIDITSSELQNFEIDLLKIKEQFHKNENFNNYQHANKEDDYKIIDDFVEDVFKNKNMLAEKTESEKIQCITEGYVRAKHNYPPGYMDMKDKYHSRKRSAEKRSKGRLSVDDLTDYLGDYFIWTDILNDKTSDDKLFVTNDLKEDWWTIPKSKKLEDYIARSELLDEFSSINSESTITFIPFDLFIYYLTIHFNVESVESYFYANVDVLFSEQINNHLSEYLLDTLTTKILEDSKVNRGMKIQNFDVQIEYVTIESFDLIEIQESHTSPEGDISVEISADCYYICEGTWNVDLGMDDDVYDSARGSFGISDGVIPIKLSINFMVNEADDIENHELQNSFNIISHDIIEFEDVETGPIIIEDNTYSYDMDDYYYPM